MTKTQDEAKRLRVRGDSLAADLIRGLPSPGQGAPCLVARTTRVATYPTGARSYFACTPVTVLGTEAEGAVAELTTLAAGFFALNLGGTVPPQGTDVVATFVGNRWVFRYDA